MSWAFGRSRVVIVPLVAVVFAAGGCSSSGSVQMEGSSAGPVLPQSAEPAGATAASRSVAASTPLSGQPDRSASASTLPAPLPTAAREHSSRGAEAFVRHFLNEYNRAATTPVVGLLAPMSQPSCKSCSRLERDIQALLDDREKYLVSPLRIDGVTCVACGPEQRIWYVHAWVFSRPAKIADVRGKPVQTMASSTDILHFALDWRSAGWSVTKIMVVR